MIIRGIEELPPIFTVQSKSVDYILRMKSSFSPSPKLVLCGAIIAVSTAAPLAKFAADVHPIAIGFWRTLIVGVLLAILSIRSPPRLRKGGLVWSMLAGTFLALHFWAWFASLRETSVLRSTVLVCLNPIWTGLLEFFIFKRPQSTRYWAGVGIALLGLAVMNGEADLSGNIKGDALALIGGILGSCYMISGRRLRQHIDIVPYGAIVCLSCALSLGLIGLVNQVEWTGYAMLSWAALAVMAIGPQFFGHIGINYALKSVTAASIALLLLLEPVGAALISTMLLDEWPTLLEVIGSTVILMGVALGALTGRTTRSKPQAEPAPE